MSSTPSKPIGFAAVGDSYCAGEYEFAPNRPTARAWFEQLAIAPAKVQLPNNRGIDFGQYRAPMHPDSSTGETAWPAPRDHGFEFAWGVGDTGALGNTVNELVPLLKQKSVEYVYMGVVQRDIALHFTNIYNGKPLKESIRFVDILLGHVKSAVSTLSKCGAKVILANCGDFGNTPFVRNNSAFSDAVGRSRVRGVVQYANQRLLWDVARPNNIPIVDLAGLGELALYNSFDPGGIQLDCNKHEDIASNPEHMFEDSQHWGSVMHGILANCVLFSANAHYKLSITLLTNVEITQNTNHTAVGAKLPIPSDSTLIFDVSPFVFLP